MSGIFKTALLKQLKFQHAPDFFPSATSKTAAIFFGASYILKMPSHQIKEANVVLLPLLAQILTSLEMMDGNEATEISYEITRLDGILRENGIKN
jgi:hypothetical protein